MNIVDAYIQRHGSLVVIVTGLTGSGKTLSACELAEHFGIQWMNTDEYVDESRVQHVTVRAGDETREINDWDDPSLFEWERIERAVRKQMSRGVVVSCPCIPADAIRLLRDEFFHIHIKVSKRIILAARRQYAKDHPDECAEYLELVDTPFESAMLNQVVMPRYYDLLKNGLHIHKFINLSSDGRDLDFGTMHASVNEQMIDYLYDVVTRWLDEHVQTTDSASLYEWNVDHGEYDPKGTFETVIDDVII